MPLRVVIIGGGPAGCAAAIKLAAEPDIDVTLIERSAYRNDRVGETLLPQAAGLLASLGVWDDFMAAGPVTVGQIGSAWASTELSYASLLTQPHGRGWHIQRSWFDALLAEAAVVAGTELLIDTQVQGVEASLGHDNEWSLTLKPSRQPVYSLAADFIIDASGHTAKMARYSSGEPAQRDLQLALVARCVLESGSWANADSGLLLETVPAGWMYCAPVTEQQCVVTLMTNRSALRVNGLKVADSWQQALADSLFIRERLAGYTLPEKMDVYPSWSQQANCCYGERWVAIGDAALSFDPLTGMGMTKAMADACEVAGIVQMAARRIVPDVMSPADDAYTPFTALSADFSHYAARQQAAFQHYQSIRRAYYRMEKRWPDRPYWHEAQQL